MCASTKYRILSKVGLYIFSKLNPKNLKEDCNIENENWNILQLCKRHIVANLSYLCAFTIHPNTLKSSTYFQNWIPKLQKRIAILKTKTEKFFNCARSILTKIWAIYVLSQFNQILSNAGIYISESTKEDWKRKLKHSSI